MDLHKYNLFIFDCDGVILDSNSIKTKAFEETLNSFPDKSVKKLIDYHLKNGGISRFRKFEKFFNDFYSSDNKENEIDESIRKFSMIVKSKLLDCDFVPGSIEYIKFLYSNKKRIYINSGSDEQELNEIFTKRNIEYLFHGIKGSPRNKEQNMEIILRTEKADKTKTIFFGDSNSDYQASKKFGVDFVFVKGYSEWSDYPSNLDYLKDFNELIIL